MMYVSECESTPHSPFKCMAIEKVRITLSLFLNGKIIKLKKTQKMNRLSKKTYQYSKKNILIRKQIAMFKYHLDKTYDVKPTTLSVWVSNGEI